MDTKYLKQESGTIAYDDQGKGPLVVCVPSLGDVRSEYRFLVPQLVSAGYRAVSMDVRGMGETSVEWKDYSVAAVGSDILALVRKQDASPAVIVGTSMAAGAAVWAAVEEPELIRGMILVGPFVRGDGNRFLEFLFSVMLARPWGPSMWAKYYSSLYPTCKPADFAGYNAALEENLKQPGRVESLVKMLKTSKRASEERIASVRQPSLVIMGSKDPDFKRPESEAQWISEHLKTDYAMVENAGHYPHAEMPDVAGPMMLKFIQSLPG
jgi:pimeloyl-ACP methyl ester carboxylesterase